MRAGVYGRESKGKSKSVDDQVRTGCEEVRDQGWTLAGQWRDGSSASQHAKRARKGWPEVRAAITAGDLDVLVLWETSRGSRTMAEWVSLVDDCRDHGVLVHIVSDERTYDPRKTTDRKALLTSGVDAEAEVSKLRDRVCRGINSAAAEGGFHGRVPYGYMRVITGERRTEHGLKTVKEQRPDPATAPIVLEIVTRVAKNEPLRAIIRDLAARGIPSPAGGRWTYDQIHLLVKNPAYIGQRRHRPVNGGPEHVYAGTWDGIVPPAMQALAQKVLDDPARRKSSAPGAVKYLLTVIATAPCGGVLGSKRYGNVIRYSCDIDGCASIGMVDADEFVTRLVIERLSRKDARSLWVKDDTTSKAAQAELADLERQMAENDEAYRRNEISARLAGIREAELEPLIADARRRSRPTGVPLALLQLLDAAEVGEEHVRPCWDGLTMPARREVLRVVFPNGIALGSASTRLSRWSTENERMAHAAQRIVPGW